MKAPRAFEWFSERWEKRRQSRREWPDVNNHMFVDDVHAFVIPYRHRENSPLEAQCEGTDDDVGIALRTLQFLASRSSGRDNATEIVCEAVRTIVQYMMWHGYAAFEIGDLASDDHESFERARRRDWKEGGPFRPLKPLHYRSLFRLPGATVGVVVSERRRWEDRESSRIRFFGPKQIWFVDIPWSLGSRLGFWWAKKKLRQFSNVFPQWTATQLVTEQNRLRFDVARYSQRKAAYQALAVKHWSWNGRDTSLTHQTEFFAFYRTLGFHYAVAILREHVIVQINNLLSRRLGLNARIKVTGLKTADQILEIRARMERGEVSLGDAFEEAAGL